MGRKRCSAASPLPDVSRRIEAVVAACYDGSAKKMATHLGTPYLAILRALRGASPNVRLLSALVTKGGIDASWLLTGDPWRKGDVPDVPI